ncbi:thiamine phosphate synthase [Anaerovorax odorimutans]|uniref:Thiamine phosphate synthase n=1 Tax=Anaerovorax odorimutans TaxID=109327 RepID=A0ABT1RLJ4_9FIRM|nr:thiamine phosphate synthase [Anaerovorax odorimutans]MCQ4636065.1 thiamine phosphate synthase [Anaerovorax odorimutans]
MSSFKRIAISNRHLCLRPLPRQVLRLSGQVDALILREKDLSEDEYEILARRVQEACQAAGIQLICHTFAEAARKIGCGSLHLPLPLLLEKQGELGDFSLIGASVHSLEEARLAQQAGANYVTASNIYETGCKAGLPGKGTAFLKEICAETSMEVFALGGITDENEGEIRAAGAQGACRMSGYMQL